MTTRTVSLLLCAWGLAALCPAPVERRPNGAAFYPEASQGTLQQAQAGAISPSGPTPVAHPEESRTVDLAATSNNAEAALQKANEAKSVDALTQASKKLETVQADPMQGFLWGVAFVLAGLGAVVGLKRYADKVVPASPGESRRKPTG